MGLHVEHRGTATGPPVVLLHGFTQTARCWGPVDDDLATDHHVTAIDAPGHGGSTTVAADLEAGADLVAQAIGSVSRPVTLVGYSMGGRLALHVALAHPALVARLVLIGATPGIDDADARAARRAADERLADRIVSLGVPAFLDEWLALPLLAGLDPERTHRAERETNTVDGLASSLRLAGTGTQTPLWRQLGQLTMPVLLVTGQNDPRFTAIAAQMLPRLDGPAELVVVPGAGHTVHLEQPGRFLARLRPWLAATTATGDGATPAEP